MSNRYTLNYWPIPFRGQFIRYVLAHAGQDWAEPGPEAVDALRVAPVGDQPLPMMAPPMLHDAEADVWLSQMPAILSYLARQHGLMPEDSRRAALTDKVVADCNDVLDEMTQSGGKRMWDQESWDAYAEDRLPRWLAIFEETGRAHGLTREGGTILGTEQPVLADLATACLWATMTEKLPPLARIVEDHAPAVLYLSRRIAARGPIAAMRAEQDAKNGAEVWYGGQIEASLREVLGA